MNPKEIGSFFTTHGSQLIFLLSVAANTGLIGLILWDSRHPIIETVDNRVTDCGQKIERDGQVYCAAREMIMLDQNYSRKGGIYSSFCIPGSIPQICNGNEDSKV